MTSHPRRRLPILLAAIFSVAILALPAGPALAQLSAPGRGYSQDAPPSGNAAMTPLAAPNPRAGGSTHRNARRSHRKSLRSHHPDAAVQPR